MLTFSFLVFLIFFYYAKDLPRPEKFTERSLFESTKIYDREGKVLLYELYGEVKRTTISLDQLPDYLKLAVIAAEDANFYSHFGLDLKGILRAALINLKLKKPVHGGSTISQQLIRSTFLSPKKTLERKIKEIVLTLELERKYSKDQILEFYLNQVPWGSNCYGVEAASQTYFGKSAKDLSLAEAATLAAMIRAPSYLSPYGKNQDQLLQRKDYILKKMEKLGWIKKEEAKVALAEKIQFSKIRQPIKAYHFVLYVKDWLVEKYGEDFLQKRGLKVYTTLDFELQKEAEKIVEELARQNLGLEAHNAALVALNPKTGEILAMIGSKDPFLDPYPEGCQPGANCLFEPYPNVALLPRQPGSAFKPFVYAAAFKKGYTPQTIIWDVKTSFGIWGKKEYIPQNYDQKFRGPVSFYQALAQSLNVPSIKVLYLAGVKDSIELAKKLGIQTLNQPPSFYGLSLVLGGGEVSLLEITSAFGVFANEGYKVSPTPILKIEDSQGNLIEEIKKTPKKVLSTQIARLINQVLSDNQARAPMFGENSPLYLPGFEVCAKTGTTQDFKDGWTIGYSTSISLGVWVGNNDATPMAEEPGVVLAGPIWHRVMKKALEKYPPQPFLKPEPIEVKKPILKGEIDLSSPHSILHYLKKDDPQGPPPKDPSQDPQYQLWEEAIKEYLSQQ
jgi:1A family penicillin-binding protein